MSQIISQKDSWKMFNNISLTYDKINRILSLNQDKKWRKELAKKLPEKKGLKILDIASGTLDQVIAYFDEKKDIESVTALDLAEKMLSIGKEKIQSKEFRSKVHFSIADAQKLPFKDETFDFISCSFGIRNVPNVSLALKEMYRVLKPGGSCHILEFSIPAYPFKAPFLFYLRHVLPKIGNFLSSQNAAYTYLNQTIESFPCGDQFVRIMKGEKFTKLELKPMMLGAVSLYSGTKK